MNLEIADVVSPIDKCPNCQCDMFLEPNPTLDGYLIRCWKCEHYHHLNLDFVERYAQRINKSIRTWRIQRTSRKFPDGALVLGYNLFTTTEKLKKYEAIIDKLGVDNYKTRNMKRHIEDSLDREETIMFYIQAHDVKNAYHYAASKHNCTISGNGLGLNCKEMVNWIAINTDSVIGEHMNLFTLIVRTWQQCCTDIKNSKSIVTNETELKTKFINIFENHEENLFEIQMGLERELIIDGARMRPDAQIESLAVIEFKSFFNTQHYSLTKAAQLLEDDMRKFERYREKFQVGFLLCYSNIYTEKDLRKNICQRQNFPVRFIVNAR